MPKYCGYIVNNLGESYAQLLDLCTVYTASVFIGSQTQHPSHQKHTGFAQILDSFTQAVVCIFNQFTTALYPLSTVPITTTKLIKE
jgi:hypothetical protein